MKTFDYSEALQRLKEGKKVSCVRWGMEGKVYVFLSRDAYYEDGEHYGAYNMLLLKDTTRDTLVAFTPSVENQIEDEWYECGII